MEAGTVGGGAVFDEKIMRSAQTHPPGIFVGNEDGNMCTKCCIIDYGDFWE